MANRFRGFAFALSIVLVAGAAGAQDTTGTVAGTVRGPDEVTLPGVSITIESTDTGLERNALSNQSSAYRISALPPGPYLLTVSLDGFEAQTQGIRIGLGTTVNFDFELAIGAFTNTIDVGGEVPAVDFTSSHTGRNLDVGRLDTLLPLNHDTTQIAILVPGTVPGDQGFNPVSQACTTGCGNVEAGWGTPGQALLSFQGASIAENLYVVDGLNITNFSQGLGSSFVPMAFVDEVQVKQGGLEAEFGRTTGGVVNMVTKSGTNTLRGDAAVLYSPENLQELSPSTHQEDFENEMRQSTEVTAALGGALLRDRLFFFLFLRYLDAERTALPGHARYLFDTSTPYWGGKVEWSLGSGHRLEATYISDQVDERVTREVHDPETGIDSYYPGKLNRGGDNAILRYSGVLADNFVLSAQIGRNAFDRYDSSKTDECPVSIDWRSGSPVSLGCWVMSDVGIWADARTAARADVDWFLGRHSLRAGVDFEFAETEFDHGTSGDDQYLYYVENRIEKVNIFSQNSVGVVEVESTAAYAQDSWAVTRSLTLNFGLRWEAYQHRNTRGETYLAINDQVAPRLGFVWDPTGTGRSKIYGSLGQYHIPYPTQATTFWVGAYSAREQVYVLEGSIKPDGSPEGLGELLSGWEYEDSGEDPRRIAADSIDPASQLELILGFDRQVGADWRLGIRGVARNHESVIEDFSLNQALREVYRVSVFGHAEFRIGNPGQGFEGWYDLDGDGKLDPISLTAGQLGYPEPTRDYYAVDLVAGKRFADNWMLEASYTWSHSYGNYEGLVRSDLNQIRAGTTSDFNFTGLMEHASGDLPNDRRHFGRVYGAYSWPWGLGVGGSFFIQSGRPISSLGYNPDDVWARLFTDAESFFTLGEPTPRGSMGRTDTLWWLDLTLRYDWRWGGAVLSARVDVFNVFDRQGVSKVEEVGELQRGQAYEYWGEPLFFQNPRSVRFGLGVSF